MGRGIIGTVQLAAVLAFALPVALVGGERLLSGDVLVGAGLVGLAALMVAVEEYVTSPADLPAAAVGDAADYVVGGEGEVSEDGDADEEA